MNDSDFIQKEKAIKAENPSQREGGDPTKAALREALETVLGQIPSVITATVAVEFFDNEGLTPGKRWSIEEIDFDYLMDAASEINSKEIGNLASKHMTDNSEIRPDLMGDLMEALSTCVGNMSDNAYQTADIVARRGWQEDESRSRFAKSAQDVVTLIELLGGDTQSSVLAKKIYATLLFQAFNGRDAWNNIMIRSGESSSNRPMSEGDILNQVEFQMNRGFMEAVGAKRAVLRALSEVPYVVEAGFANADDDASGSHITFRIDPRKYAEASKISKFPRGFYDYFDFATNIIAVDSYGISEEPIPDSVDVSLMQYRESGSDAIYYRDGSYKAVVSVEFDLSLESTVDCRLGSGSISFSQIDFDKVPLSQPGTYSNIPEAIIKRYIGFSKDH
jgi:hypothetical protein